MVERIGQPGSARLAPLVAAHGLLRVRAATGLLYAGTKWSSFRLKAALGSGESPRFHP